jgi:hypothetical protein
MKPFLHAGFLLALLIEMDGSRVAWQIARRFTDLLRLTHLQRLLTENWLRREQDNPAASHRTRATVSNALQNLHHYIDEQVFQPLPLDYDIAIQLAGHWQGEIGTQTPPALLLLWPALAVTAGATHFLSFDPRPRRLAKAAGLKLLPETL